MCSEQLELFNSQGKPIDDYSRGRNNEVSKEMFETKIKETQGQMKEKILRLIDGEKCTKEIADLLGKEYHKISGRFSQLKFDNIIHKVGVKELNGSKYTIYAK